MPWFLASSVRLRGMTRAQTALAGRDRGSGFGGLDLDRRHGCQGLVVVGSAALDFRQLTRSEPAGASRHGDSSITLRMKSRAGADVVVGLVENHLAVGVKHGVIERVRFVLVEQVEVAEPVHLRFRLAERNHGADRKNAEYLAPRGIGQPQIEAELGLKVACLLQDILANFGGGIGCAGCWAQRRCRTQLR